MAIRKWLIRFFILVLTLSAGGAYYVYGQYTNPDAVAQLVLQELHEHFPGAEIQLGHAEWSLFSGVRLNELRVTPEGEKQPAAVLHQTILQIDKAQAARGKFELQRVQLHQPSLHLERDQAGRWNVLHLLTAKPKSSGNIPFVLLHNGFIRFHDRKLDFPVLDLKEVNAKFLPGPAGVLLGDGTGTSDVLGPLDFQFSHQPQSHVTELVLSLPRLTVQPKMEQILDRLVPGWRAEVNYLRGMLDLQIKLTWQGESEVPQVRSTIKLTAGEIRHARLPIPLHQVECELEYSGETLWMHTFTARAEEGVIRGHGRVDLAPNLHDFSKHQAQVHLDYANVRLHAGIYPSLPVHLRKFCQEFQTQGLLNGSLDAAWKQEKLTFSYILKPHQGRFEAIDFPYPAREVTGVLRYEETNDAPALHVDLRGLFGQRMFDLRGTLFGVGLRPENPLKPGVDLTLHSADVPMDEALLHALQPYPETLQAVKRFHAQGSFDCQVRLKRDPGKRVEVEPPLRRWVTAQLKNMQFRFEAFPCPIDKVTGKLEIDPDKSWRLTQFRGEHRGGKIHGLGWLTTTRAGDVLHLDLWGSRVPFSPELRAALPGEVRQVWDHFQPEGRADCKVIYDQLEKGKPTVEVTVKPQDARMQMVSFPYPLQQVHGSFRYLGQQVEIHSLSATNGKTILGVHQGHITIRPGGGFLAQLYGISFDQLIANNDFLSALPGLMRESARMLDSSQPVNARFDLEIDDAGQGKPPRLNWSGNLELQRNRLNCGCCLENLTGLLVLDRGSYANGKLETAGRLYLQSLNVAGKQELGPLSAQLYVTEDQLQIHECRAALPGGIIHGLVEVKFGAEPRFHIDVGAEVQLERLIQKPDGPSGRAHGKLVLNGEGPGKRNLQGSGSLYIRDGANLYQLPLIIDIVNQFSQVFPKATQFQEAKLDFAVQGERVIAEKVQVLADAYKIEGNGSARVDGSSLDLLLTFVMGAGRSFPLMPASLEKAQTTFAKGLMKIHVTGSLNQVHVDVEPLPFVMEPLKELFRSLRK